MASSPFQAATGTDQNVWERFGGPPAWQSPGALGQLGDDQSPTPRVGTAEREKAVTRWDLGSVATDPLTFSASDRRVGGAAVWCN